MKRIKYIVASLFTLVYNVMVFGKEGGGDVVLQPSPEGPGAPKKTTPIDMYEWVLLLVAVSLIVGYYLYKRNRRIASS